MRSGSIEEPVLNIVGELVALGPLRADLVQLYQKWRNDFTIQRTFGSKLVPVTLEERMRWFDARTSGDQGKAHWFTIYESASLRPIGTTDLFNIDHRIRVGQLGILIGESDARNKGYGTEATKLMLDFGFTGLGLNNIMLTVAEYNVAGRRAYEKAGFREFGRRRQADVLVGKVHDEIYMDCVAEEFTSPVLRHLFGENELAK